MRLLIVTQAIDTEDPVLGFFTQWVGELAVCVDSIRAVCLKEGEHSLPENVRVHSLGKEHGVGRLEYVRRFYSYIWKFRHEYDAVFIHMNEEYVLLGGLPWILWGKRVYLWRNHAKGSWRTRIAVFLSTKVFCTSKHAFTAGFAKTTLMPVGIDLARFNEDDSTPREPRSILFLSRIAPVKRPEMFIDALGEVLARGVSFTASMYGSPLPEDQAYAESLVVRAESLGLHDRIHFHPGIANHQAPTVFRAHDVFVNCTPTGSMDKTMFEAAACGCRVIASSDDFRDAAGDASYAPHTEELVEKLIEMLNKGSESADRTRIRMQALARAESLGTLADRLVTEMA